MDELERLTDASERSNQQCEFTDLEPLISIADQDKATSFLALKARRSSSRTSVNRGSVTITWVGAETATGKIAQQMGGTPLGWALRSLPPGTDGRGSLFTEAKMASRSSHPPYLSGHAVR